MRGSCSRPLLFVALAMLMAGLSEGTQGRPAAPASQQTQRAQRDDPHSALRVRALLEGGRYSEAESVAREHLAEVGALHGADSLEAAEALDLLVESWWRQGKGIDPDLQLQARRAVERKEALLGPDHPGVAVSLDNLGMLLYQVGDLSGGISALERSLAIREKVFGPDHLEVASSLTYLGILVGEAGEGLRAKQLHERALAIRELELGPDHPDLSWNLNNLAVYYSEAGEYSLAIPLLERALLIRERAYGPDHALVGGMLNNLGSLLERSGDYARARLQFERALAIRERALGPDHPLVASTLRNLAMLLQDTGDYSEAIPLCERALAVSEKARGPGHTDVAWDLNILASLLRATGDYGRARKLYGRALAIWEKNLGPEDPAVAWGLSTLGELLLQEGKDDEARALLERAVAIWSGQGSDIHPDGVPALIHLGTLLRDMGDYARAEEFFKRATDVWEEVGAPEHPEVAWSLSRMADLLAGTGRAVSAFDTALRAERIASENLRLTSRALPERMALRYSSVRISSLDLVLSLASRELSDAPGRRWTAWDTLIQSRALVLDEMAARHRALAESGRADLVPLVGAFNSSSRRLAGLMVRGPSGLPPESYRRRLDEARRERESAETALAEKSLLFRKERERGRSGLARVAEGIPPDTALVAFALYNDRVAPTLRKGTQKASGLALPKSVPSYLAFILLAGGKDPALVRLGPASAIDAAFAHWRRQITRAAGAGEADLARLEAEYRSASLPLRRLIWDPLAPRLAGVQRVLVVPDGVLHLVSLASLPAGRSGYLIDSTPTIHYVSSERDVVPEGQAATVGKGLLALGGPDFDSLAPSSPATRPLGSSQDREEGSLGSKGDEEARCSEFPSIRFEQLRATEQEAREIYSLWRGRETEDTADRAADLLTGREATEPAFKRMAAHHRVLHLATHGFFMKSRCHSPSGDLRGIGGLEPSGEPGAPSMREENPLLLSGLALAGANARAQAGPEGEDGILTAEEITAMDLSGTEWAVLSACDTGLGSVSAGEGILGLRRAFQVAGAGTVITSLWAVEDQAAKDWMRSLYEGRLLRRLGSAEAVREAGVEVLEGRRRGGRSTHPFFWAGFVAAGDWR